MTTLPSQIAMAGIGLGGAACLSLVVSVVTARLLGVEQFGLYGFAFAYVSLWGVFMDAGGSVLASREVARGDSRRLLGILLAVKAPLLAVALPLALVIGAWSGMDRLGLTLVALLIIGTGIDTCFGVARGVFRGRREFGVDALHQMGQRALFGVLALWALLEGGGVLSVAGARAVSLALATAVALVLLRRRGALPEPSLRLMEMRDLVRVILPAGALLVIDLMSQIQLRSGSVILRHTRDLTEVGLYTAPARLLEGFALVPTAISVALLPRLVGAQRDRAGAASAEVRLSLRFTAALGAGILVALGPWAAEIIHTLFGSAYAASANALRLLLVVQLLMMLNAVLRAALIATGSERIYAALMAVAGAVAVVAALAVTPRWGATGAAASALVGELLLLVGGQLLAVRRLPDVLPLREWGIIGIASVLGLAAVVAAKHVNPVPAAVGTLVMVVVGFEALSPLSLREFLPRRRSASGPPGVR